MSIPSGSRRLDIALAARWRWNWPAAERRLSGVVSFHGGLSTDRPDDAKNIKGKILVCTGGDDAFVPPAQVRRLRMRCEGAQWIGR